MFRDDYRKQMLAEMKKGHHQQQDKTGRTTMGKDRRQAQPSLGLRMHRAGECAMLAGVMPVGAES
jgi:hypothetical protein